MGSACFSFGGDERVDVDQSTRQSAEVDIDGTSGQFLITADIRQFSQHIELAEVGGEIKIFDARQSRVIGRDNRQIRTHPPAGMGVGKGFDDQCGILLSE